MILGSGAFDGLHGGHARYIAALKQLRQLVQEPVGVAVSPDQYIVTAKRREPHWPQRERMRAVEECGVVVYDQEEDNCATLITRLKPRLFVKGIEWAGCLPTAVVEACRACNCLIVYVDADGIHTSQAIPR